MIRFKCLSMAGDRKINEDSVDVVNKEDKYCFILADGLGGHDMGNVASSLVVNTIKEEFLHNSVKEEFYDNTFNVVQKNIKKEQERHDTNKKMCSTAVVLVIDDKKASWAYIGDSRLYVFNRNKVKLRTLDHSVPQMLVASKKIKEKDIRHHIDRNKLLKAVDGTDKKPDSVYGVNLKKCQAFLLCSDGFWEYIDEKDMCKLLKKSDSVEEWLEKMKIQVLENGKDDNMDNFSAIAVFVD